MQDKEVISKVLAGDIDSFAMLVKEYEKPLCRMIANLIGNRETCQDIAQEVFLTAYKKLASFDPARSNFYNRATGKH